MGDRMGDKIGQNGGISTVTPAVLAASQAGSAGSIPVARSIRSPRHGGGFPHHSAVSGLHRLSCGRSCTRPAPPSDALETVCRKGYLKLGFCDPIRGLS